MTPLGVRKKRWFRSWIKREQSFFRQSSRARIAFSQKDFEIEQKEQVSIF